VIGAGIAGITAGVLLPRKVPGIQLTIFDKNSDVVSVQSQSNSESNLTIT
jgi:L-2-hydroxyglutarate oxidase LhgO